MKKICSVLLVLMLFVSTGGTVLAEGDFPPPEQPTTRWWPGNPNPQPGTEDWLYQNYSPNFGSTASKSQAKSCIVSIGLSLTSATVKVFFVKGPWTLRRFITYLGVAAAETYVLCLMEQGITN